MIFSYSVFFFNDTATTEIYTYLHSLTLHDALPIVKRDEPVGRLARYWKRAAFGHGFQFQSKGLTRHQPRVDPQWSTVRGKRIRLGLACHHPDRKSTRLNSSH